MKLAYSGRRADLVAVALSYDEDYRYGLQTPFSENLSRMWAGGMWHVDPTHNTFITTGNAGSESTAAEVTLFYNGGKSKYRIEKMLSSGQQLWLDVGRLIHDQVPDSDGRTLAPDTMTGSYELRDLDHATVGELYEGKLIIDKTYGHAAYGCGTCCGDGVPTLLPSPFGGPPDINNTDVMQSLEQCTGDLIDLADDAYNWNSTNTAVATLPTKVLHTVAVGSASGSGTVYVQADHPAPRCPMAYYSPSQQVVVAKLTCTSSVTLGGTATCTATGPSGSTFSNWKFTDGSNNTVTSTSTSSTWSGVMVTGGTVSVTVTSSGKSASPTAQITVNNRTNFAFSAVSPTAENNGFSGDGCTVNVPSPPAKTGDAVGAFCLAQYFSLNTAAVGDGGPNNGYSYVTSISSSSGSSTTSYFYVISPDLENSSSTFYKAQCGNYNSQTNPNGFISGANLLTDTTRHESGIVQSHYENYVVVQNTSTNNLGTVAEHMTGLESGQALATSVTSALNQNLQTITSATQVEPCSVQQDASCNFQGSSIFNRTNHAIEAYMLQRIVIALTIVAFGSPQSTPVVDLTTLVPRNRVREPVTAASSGGAVGGNGAVTERKGPIDMNVLSVEIGHGPEPFIMFEVQVRNIGGEQFEFPVDPNLADFEPENVNTAYAYTVAYIAPFLDSEQQGNIFLPGVSLYGSEYVTGSVQKLDRGESLRIRAKVPLKPVGPDGALRIPTSSSIKASLMMQRDFVSQKSGVLHEDSKQIVPQITSSNAITFSFRP